MGERARLDQESECDKLLILKSYIPNKMPQYHLSPVCRSFLEATRMELELDKSSAQLTSYHSWHFCFGVLQTSTEDIWDMSMLAPGAA